MGKNFAYIDILAKEEKRLRPVLKLYFSLSNYPKIFSNTIGFINRTYLVERGSHKFILRESNLLKTATDLKFETGVLRYLEHKRFPLTARVIPDVSGRDVVRHGGHFYMLQSFLPGRVSASWRDLKNFTLPMLKETFRVSADFAKAVRGFSPKAPGGHPPVDFYIKNWPRLFQISFRRIRERKGKLALQQALSAIGTLMDHTVTECCSIRYSSLSKQLVHFDLHPGNFHFSRGKIVGLFDFDWARLDNRLADLAATISQSCYHYGGSHHGVYRHDRVRAGIETYRRTYGKSEYTPALEDRILRTALIGYNFFQLLVIMDWYATHSREPDSRAYLDLFINLLTRNDYEKLFA